MSLLYQALQQSTPPTQVALVDYKPTPRRYTRTAVLCCLLLIPGLLVWQYGSALVHSAWPQWQHLTRLIQYRLFDRNHGPAPNDIPHWPQPVNLQALADNRTPISQNVFPPSNAVLPTHLTPADRASLSQNAVRTTASTPQTKKAPAGVIDIRPSAPLPKAKPEPTTTTPTPQIHPRQMHYDRIILALQQKQYDKAEASLHNAYQRLEQDNGLDLLRAQMLYQQNQPRQALQLMQTLSAPQHADMQQRYLWLMARLHNTTGNTELALKILKRGLRVWPHSPALWLEMANLLEQSQEVEAARSAYTFLLTLQPLPAEIKTTAEQHLQRLSR